MMMMRIAMCSASTLNTDHLRSQLDQLHSEAHITRRKADNARFRLLRLSEAAENLHRQAAVNLRKGKDDDARELLFQKKKIMSALEKSKCRVELLDELAAKLNEAISIKEAQLVRNVASDFEINGDDAGGPVRIVSPTEDDRTTLHNNSQATFKGSNFREDQKGQELIPDIVSEGDILSYSQAEEVAEAPRSMSSSNETNMLSSFRGPSSYIGFLEDLDQQLNKIECDLVTIIEVPALVTDNEEIPNNTKVQQLKILENIRSARERIRGYVEEITGIR